jgi:cobalt-zinc-cadmium efflux system outer membrane protein
MNRLATLAAFAFLTLDCSAQQAPKYSWNQIHDIFLRSNPSLRAQKQTIVSSQAAEVTAGLRPNPTLQNDTTSATLGLYQEFEIGGKRTARIRSARLATEISRTDAADTERLLTLDLRQAYVSALQAQSDLKFARENLANYHRTVELNRQMLQQGEIARADYLRIQLQTLQFETDVDDATLELSTAKANLRGLLGAADLPHDFEVDGELEATPFDDSLAHLKDLALTNRPDLQSSDAARRKAAADVQVAQANRWPDPTVGISFLHTGNEMPGPQWFEPFYSRGATSNGMGVGVALIPLPIFNRNQGEIARAKSEEVRAGLLAQAARNQVILDVESAYAQFISARDRLHLYEATYLGAAKESLDIEDFSFHKGGASVLDFLDAERTYRATQLGYHQQLAAYLVALAQLRSAAGLDIAP